MRPCRFLGRLGMAYEDALDQAAELEQIYAQTLAAGQHVQAQQSPISPTHGGLQFSPTDMGQAQAMAMAFSSPQVRTFLCFPPHFILSDVGGFGSANSTTFPVPHSPAKVNSRRSLLNTLTTYTKAEQTLGVELYQTRFSNGTASNFSFFSFTCQIRGLVFVYLCTTRGRHLLFATLFVDDMYCLLSV